MAIELPIRIQQALATLSSSCSEPAYVKSRQDVLRRQIGNIADAHENGWYLFRVGAVEQLQNDDPRMIGRPRTCLFVVGERQDTRAVEPLTKHPNESVSKAARTCLFELRHRAPEGL